jgi:hypothetical protein
VMGFFIPEFRHLAVYSIWKATAQTKILATYPYVPKLQSSPCWRTFVVVEEYSNPTMRGNFQVGLSAPLFDIHLHNYSKSDYQAMFPTFTFRFSSPQDHQTCKLQKSTSYGNHGTHSRLYEFHGNR